MDNRLCVCGKPRKRRKDRHLAATCGSPTCVAVNQLPANKSWDCPECHGLRPHDTSHVPRWEICEAAIDAWNVARTNRRRHEATIQGREYGGHRIAYAPDGVSFADDSPYPGEREDRERAARAAGMQDEWWDDV